MQQRIKNTNNTYASHEPNRNTKFHYFAAFIAIIEKVFYTWPFTFDIVSYIICRVCKQKKSTHIYIPHWTLWDRDFPFFVRYVCVPFSKVYPRSYFIILGIFSEFILSENHHWLYQGNWKCGFSRLSLALCFRGHCIRWTPLNTNVHISNKFEDVSNRPIFWMQALVWFSNTNFSIVC